jgi:gliding motility-associated-like protein
VPICPVNPGDVVTVTFTSFNTEATWDGLYVFDGNSILSPQIPSANPAGNVPGALAGSYWGDLTGNLPGPFTSTSNDGCLTFRFRSDGSGSRAGWVANVICSPGPNCLKPTLLTSTNITATSASLGWAESNSAVTQWEIIYLPFGQPVPLPTATGVLVTSNPVVISGLLPGTRYTFYVRAICPTSGTSSWSNGASFTTLIINDSCSGAIFTPVNSTLTCYQVVAGTITSATASTPAPTAPCVGTADDDVWFQFIATNTYLNISLLDVQGQNNLNFGVYSGLCGTLTQVFCSANNALSGIANGLVLGQTYYVRVYSNASTPQTSSFNLCISTPSTCSNANTICNLLGENTPSTTGVSSLGTIGCLFSSPNPTFYTLEVGTSGPINLFLSQNALPNGQGVGRDIDYAAWGPFNSQVEACNVVGNQAPYAAPGIGVPVTQTTGCSFSAAATETLNITNAQAGQVYIILITNFSQQPGFINLVQTNIGQAGAGTVNCCPEAFFSYSPSTYCQTPGNPNPLPIVAPGSLSGVFSSPFTPGLVFANSTTGAIDLLASAPGNYVIVNTLAATASCDERQRIYTINISQPTSATISYNSITYCESDTTVQQVTQTGTTGGSYSAIPNVGLSINPTTGEINPSLSSPAVYSVVYGLPGSICTIGNPSTQVEIIDAPVPTFTQVAPICPGAALADLPTSSNDTPPITGTWSPVINNTATTTYTFTPTAGQCAETTTMTINVGSTTPTFNAVAPICPGAPLATLPTTSLNGIDGFWTPALDNTQTTTYTFTPTSGTCVGSTTLTIGVLSPTIVPTFNVVSPICPNGTISPLPTISLNGITGVWSPALDNTQTTTYTFTPVTGQCGLTTTLQITVNPQLVVTVNNPTFCPGSSATMVATPSIPGTYTYTWTVPAGVPDPGNVASFTTTTPGTYTVVINQVNNFCNTDFETPVIPATANPSLINESLVPCWDTTASDGVIEMWPPGFTGVTAYSGNQLIELNANLVGTLFQDFIVIPGTTISVSFAHRGRQGNDVVGVEIGPVGGPYVSLGNFTDGNTAWVLHTVNYTIPIGSGNNYTLRFVSVSSAGGSPSIGNLLDSISISSLSCTSAPASGIATSIAVTPVTTFDYPTPICQNATTNPLPGNFPSGFTTGGNYSEDTAVSTGLVFVSTATGEIDLINTTPGSHTIIYAVLADPSICQSASSSSFTIVINSVITPVTGFNYTSPICQNAQATLSPTLVTGFTTGGTFSSTTGLTIDASTGVVNLAASTSGNYTITYVSNANAATCLVAGTNTANIVISPIITPGTGFNYTSPICQNAQASLSPTLNAGFTTGGTFSSTTGLTIDTSTGVINLVTSTPGNYTITYVSNANAATCLVAGTNTASISISAEVTPVTEFTYVNTICQNAQPTISPTLNAGFTSGGTFSSTIGLTIEPLSGVIDLAGSTPGNYTITYVSNANAATCLVAGTNSANLVIEDCIIPPIPKGVSVNGDGFNDYLVLSNVAKLTIFNRLGMKVYSRNNYTNEWGGQSDDGDELPDGTYYYSIDFNGGQNRTGWIYLSRAQ